MIVYRGKQRSCHGFSRGEAVKNLRFLTDEECGRKSNGYPSVSGFYKPTDFAIPHPSALTGCHLPPGGRYNGCSDLGKINDHLFVWVDRQYMIFLLWGILALKRR